MKLIDNCSAKLEFTLLNKNYQDNRVILSAASLDA